MLLGLLLEFEFTQLYSLRPTTVSLPGGPDAKSELISTQWLKYSFSLNEPLVHSTKFNTNQEKKTEFTIYKA